MFQRQALIMLIEAPEPIEAHYHDLGFDDRVARRFQVSTQAREGTVAMILLITKGAWQAWSAVTPRTIRSLGLEPTAVPR